MWCNIIKLYKAYAIFLLVLLVLPQIYSYNDANAYSDHPNLFVSAENSVFQNHFAGAMVIEVIVKEDNSHLDQAQGEPNVSVNGRQLHMAQATDSYWYAFFANTQMAEQASAISSPGGVRGKNLDFGNFCSGSTPSSVLGVDFSQTDGVAIPPNSGLSGTTTGLSSFTACSGIATSPSSLVNVIRNPPSLNTDPHVPVGQIGINPKVWPVIQLFTFSNDVNIEYNRATGAQSVDLTYFDIPNININLDRPFYPTGSEVFATINDVQLDEDPTSTDSWTFNVSSPQATFYQAFPESGGSSTSGLVNLAPSLSNLGFKDNGKVSMNLGNVIALTTNAIQSSSSITLSGTTYNNLVTFLETGPNTGIFESDYNSASTIGTQQNAPRGQSGSIEYNQQTVSIVSGTETGSLTVGNGQGQFSSGQRETITLTDPSQVRNSAITETLDDFRSSTLIPTLKIGNPVTLSAASGVNFYQSATNFLNPISAPSSVSDPNSVRLVIDTRSITPPTNFAKIILNLGITTQTLKNLFIDTSQSNSNGNNWINYDLRSFQQQLGISSFSSTSMTLYFGSPGTSAVPILTAGSISSGNGLVQISNSVVASIKSQSPSSQVYLEINFGSLGGKISNKVDTQPIVFDLFSFGTQNGQTVNNAIYRAELQETSPGSGIYTGTIQYVMPNQLNQFDPSLIEGLSTFGSNIKFLSTGQMVAQNGMRLSVTGIQAGKSTTTTSQNNLPTQTGTVTLNSPSYRIGSDVTITMNDPDLAGDANTIQSFTTVNDPNSAAVDTVGDNSGNILLEVWIKGFRFQRCTINGQTYGGLGATGFTLTETGPGTGVFQGSFKMPSRICSEDGTQLISPIGGSVEAWYHDVMNVYGAPEVIHSTVSVPLQTNSSPVSQQQYLPMISQSTQISDSTGRPVLENPKEGQAINFNGQISNNDVQNTQQISYILQVKDSQGQVVYLNHVDDAVGPLTNVKENIQWTPPEPGSYTAEIYVWDGMNSLVPLTEQKEFKFQVLSQ